MGRNLRKRRKGVWKPKEEFYRKDIVYNKDATPHYTVKDNHIRAISQNTLTIYTRKMLLQINTRLPF